MDKIRILILDDHALFREGIGRLLGTEPDFKVVETCSSVEEGLIVLASTPIDLVLLDVDLGPERGSEFLRRAYGGGYGGRVLIVTAGISDLEAAQVVSQGAAGIFLKHHPPALLARSIRAVMRGEAWLDQRYLQAVIRGRSFEAPDHKARLSDRERQVLRGVFEGLANKEIGSRLQISETSVKAALQQLFQKTGVRTRSQLVRIALEQFRDQL